MSAEPDFFVELKPWKGGKWIAEVRYFVGKKRRIFLTAPVGERKEAVRLANSELLAMGHNGKTFRVNDFDGDFTLNSVVASTKLLRPRPEEQPTLFPMHLQWRP
jgi:hypothetical protein